jgi:hypothetical protein
LCKVNGDAVKALDAIIERAKAFRTAQIASERAGQKAMDRGGTRARLTTANANWKWAAEHRDHCKQELAEAIAAAGMEPRT